VALRKFMKKSRGSDELLKGTTGVFNG
jgi:hypothetical protein